MQGSLPIQMGWWRRSDPVTCRCWEQSWVLAAPHFVVNGCQLRGCTVVFWIHGRSMIYHCYIYYRREFFLVIPNGKVVDMIELDCWGQGIQNIVTSKISWHGSQRSGQTHQVLRELEVDRLETRKLLHQQWNTGGPYSLQGVDRLPRTISREIITSCPGSSKPVFQEISRLDHRIGQRIKQTQKAILHQSWSCGKFWERWSVTFLVCIGYHQGYFF